MPVPRYGRSQAIKSYQQLLEWVLPPLVICAFWGALKKSIETIWPRWLCRRYSSSVRRPTHSAQDARNGALGDGDAKHLQLAVNPRGAPQRIGRPSA